MNLKQIINFILIFFLYKIKKFEISFSCKTKINPTNQIHESVKKDMYDI